MAKLFSFFFQAEDGIRDYKVTGVQTCALPASIALVHRRGELREPRARPRVGDEYGPYGIGGRQPDVHDHDSAAPLARQQVTPARAPERDRQLGAHRSVRLAARQVESSGPVDRDDGRVV